MIYERRKLRNCSVRRKLTVKGGLVALDSSTRALRRGLSFLIKRLWLFHQTTDKLGGTVGALIYDDIGDAHVVHPYFLLDMAGAVHARRALSANLCSEREFAHGLPRIKM